MGANFSRKRRGREAPTLNPNPRRFHNTIANRFDQDQHWHDALLTDSSSCEDIHVKSGNFIARKNNGLL